MAYRSRPRPSSTLGAKASTMCPYYLDGDQTEPVQGSAGDTRCHPRLSSTGGMWLLCSFQGPSERATRARPPARWPAAGDAVSQNSTACTGSSSAVCLAGPARFGRHARPHGRRPTLPDRSRPKWRAGRSAPCRTGTVSVLPRKEVIQPHLPVRLPCYDFTPVTSPTFDGSLPCGLGHRLRVLLTPVV